MGILSVSVCVLVFALVLTLLCVAYCCGRIKELNGHAEGESIVQAGGRVWIRRCEICGSPASSLKINVNSEEIASIFLCEECLVDGLRVEYRSE